MCALQAGGVDEFKSRQFECAHRQPYLSRPDIANRCDRLDVAWGPMDAQPRSHVRLAFLALLCVETAMPYGGRIEISQTEGKWLLHGRADKLNIDAPLWDVLSTKQAPPDLRPAQVQFALLPLIAADMDRRIHVEIGADTVKLSF